MRTHLDRAQDAVGPALVEGRRRSVEQTGPSGSRAVLALQRYAGNAAVSALMAGKLRSPGAAEIDAALVEVRHDEPQIDAVEKGLKAAQAAGVPVELEGPKPPASALAVTKTGFGPGSVAPKKPVPPPKKTPALSPLGKAAAAKPRVPAAAKAPGTGYAVAPPPAAAPLAPVSSDKLLEPPTAPIGVRPEEDPAFANVKQNVKGFGQAKKAHPPAGAKAKEAQGAALAPADDLAGQAKAAKVTDMDAQPAGTFDKKAFIAAVKTAIEAKSPKTLKEADDYKESGKAGEVKGDIQGMVSQGKEGQSKDIEAATEAPPDQSKAVAKPVTPMAQEDPGPVANIPAAGAVPKQAPAEQTNLEAGKHQANQEMAEGGVSEEQLANSNEPQFQQALTDKHAAAEHADTAPGEYRQHEAETLSQHKEQAAAETSAGVTGMQSAKGAALAKLVADKGKTKSKDEQKRAEVTTKIQGIFAAAESDVKKILEGIDPKVDAAFTAGETLARTTFESYVSAKMSAYKEDRYSGWLGGMRWAKDKLFGMPDKVNEFYEAGRELYLQKMDDTISRVADIVGNDLAAAKTRIAKGKADIAAYVKSLPRDLQKVGSEATKEINDKFEALEDDVNSKQDSVVDTLASKYVEARKGLDDRIEELQAENKGLVDKAIGAIKAVINTIRELVSMLTNVLARAASVIGDIVKDPVRFLGNLIDGIKGGILKFKDNIVDHLRKGLMGWLFGALAENGIELPETFDIKGIVHLLASIFGLTWNSIKGRIVKKIGQKAMDAVEKGVTIFTTLKDKGIAGLWDMVVEKLGDIKEMILEQVKDFVITKIITAGITWLIGLLNPAAAFIKACKLIYDVVMFFVDNAARIMKFVNTVIDSVADVVKGNISGVIDKIDDVLGQMVPILIGFLASVIGIGGIGEKIRSIIDKLQKPFHKAVDFVIDQGLKVAGPLIRGAQKLGGKVKGKIAAGKAWVKGKATQVKEKALSLVRSAFGMKGESHTLTISPAGDIEMASAKSRKLGPLLSTVLKDVEARKKAMTAAKQRATEIVSKGKRATKTERTLLETINKYLVRADQYVSDVKAIDDVRRQIERSRANNPKSLLSRLGNMLASLGTRFDLSDVGPLKGPDAKVIGTIDEYAELKSGRVNELGTGEAEHVLPGATMEAFMRGWNRDKVFYVRGSGADSVYKHDITLLIPKRMADIKTDLGAAGLESDQDMIRRIKSAMTEARALDRQIGRGGKPDKKQKAQLAAIATRAGSLDQLVLSRVKLVIAAREKYIQELRQGTSVGLPTGMTAAQAIRIVEENLSDGKINQAALEQLANVWTLDPLG